MSSADERPEGKWNFENEETGQAAPISAGQGELFPAEQPFAYAVDTVVRAYLESLTPEERAAYEAKSAAEQDAAFEEWLGLRHCVFVPTRDNKGKGTDGPGAWIYPSKVAGVVRADGSQWRLEKPPEILTPNTPALKRYQDIHARLTAAIKEKDLQTAAELAAQLDDAGKVLMEYSSRLVPDNLLGDLTGGTQSKPRQRQKKKLAAESGAVELPKNIINPTGKDFKNALSSKRKGKAFLIPLQDGELEKMEVDETTGRLSLKGDRWMEAIELKNLKTREVVGGRALAFIRTLYTIVMKHGEQIQNGRYHVLRVYRPILCEHLGMTAYPADIKNDVITRIREEMKDIVGYLEDGKSYYPAFSFQGYNNEDDTVDFTVPYLSRLVSEIKRDPARKIKTSRGEVMYTLPAYSETIHGSIANEKDHVAIAIVFRIDALIHSRPNTKSTITGKDGKRSVVSEKGATQNISFKTLMDDVPEFKVGYEAQENAKQKNKFLERHLTNAYRIIREKTDLCSYFVNLNWYCKERPRESDPIPSTTTLSRILCFSHTGVNPDWKRPR